MLITADEIYAELDKYRPGQSSIIEQMAEERCLNAFDPGVVKAMIEEEAFFDDKDELSDKTYGTELRKISARIKEGL